MQSLFVFNHDLVKNNSYLNFLSISFTLLFTFIVTDQGISFVYNLNVLKYSELLTETNCRIT